MYAGCQADRTTDDVCLGEGRVVYPLAAEGALQPPGHLEYAALPFDVTQVLLPAAVGHVLPENHDPGVPRHLVPKADIQQVDHGGRVAGELGVVFGIELLRGRVDVRGVDVLIHRVGAWLG
jgi:hypothetical protein